ncbi:MAG TPA: PAS domain S-box protein [Methanoregula sp.]|nr:PAS domain S-box protein [Methanoregula sp.]
MSIDMSLEKKQQIYWTVTILISIIVTIISTIYSLSLGIYEVFPFIYFLPIILFVYFCPDRGVLFTLGISTVYILLVYFYSGFNPDAVAVSTAWFVVFITIGVVTSSFAEGLREEERKYKGIFENTQAGIFTFNRDSLKINEINKKCANMLRYESTELTGSDLSRIIPDAESRDRFVRQIREGKNTTDIELVFTARDNAKRQFLVSATVIRETLVICSAIDITSRKMAEQVIEKAREDLEYRVNERTRELLHANAELTAEIDERKRFESAIQLANHKLNTLSSITRHDILNQITAVVMYLALIREAETDPNIIGYLEKIENITRMIQKQIQFTRDYQAIGESKPRWQDIGATIKTSIYGMNLNGVMLDIDINNLEVFADVAFPKVFTNLIQNALVHGKHVKVIRFSCCENDTDLVISCEDNGIGIPEGAEERIFRREYFRNTGYGLFLIVEILGITGLSIKETGTPGNGARFDIHVPRGSYRFVPKTDIPAIGH